MRQFRRVIHLFEKFEILYSKMTCLDKVIRKKFKFKEFWKVFQMDFIEDTFKTIRKLKFHSFSLYYHSIREG